MEPISLFYYSLKPKRCPNLPTHTLVIKSTWRVGTIWPVDPVFMSNLNDQSMSVGCIGKLGHLTCSLVSSDITSSVLIILLGQFLCHTKKHLENDETPMISGPSLCLIRNFHNPQSKFYPGSLTIKWNGNTCPSLQEVMKCRFGHFR